MNKLHQLLALAFTVFSLAVSAQGKSTPAEVKAFTQRVADWQIETFETSNQHRALSTHKLRRAEKTGKLPKKWHDLTWHMGALYAGMDQWRSIADSPEKYTDFLITIGERNNWKLYKRPYHADDHTVGQFYLSLYQEFGDKRMLEPTRKHFDWILANPKTGTLEWKAKPTDAHRRWGWCDALFMAPPVWARLAKITGEQKYLDFMDQEYHASYDLLWDTEDKLFWRDSSFFKKREKNGRKLYWARGNGWVFGGLALMIPDLPKDWEGREFYINLYKEMAHGLKNCQRSDGTWSMGLLGGVEGYPIKETSGTSFFTFGLAWGINNGLLDRNTYEPIIHKAWAALTECVTDEGLLGHVQPVGAAPGDSYPDKTEVYGIGAFLAAGTEVYKLVGGKVAPRPTVKKSTLEAPKKKPSSGRPAAPSRNAKYDRAADSHEFTVFMKEGGWCWYQDPRAIIHNNKLFIGSVKGSGNGEALIGAYDLKTRKVLGSQTVHSSFDRDDHNSPVFVKRPDGSLLTTYAKHSRDKFHYSRILDSENPLAWNDQFKHQRHSENKKDRVTYMNLYAMEDSGLLYNFYRSINFNPTFVTSTDYGKTWSSPVHFFANEAKGRHRPYPRYAGNGKDTVHLSVTDAHPRNYGNSIYYAAFSNGQFYRADGSRIKNLKTDGPLRPSEAELVYKGSMTTHKPAGFESVPGAAWTSAIELDSEQHPHIAYSLYLSNTDHRYRLASWDGAKWIDREIAYAGNCLYERESSYTGLVTMDPEDPTVVFISTDVDPTTGKETGGKHEIYRAKIGPTDDLNTIQWKAVTQNSPVRNIRPMVLRDGNKRVVLWQRGDFVSYINYQLDTIGFIEETM